MENKEIYANEISKVESKSGGFFNDSDADSDAIYTYIYILMQYRRRNITQIIYDSECSSGDEEKH